MFIKSFCHFFILPHPPFFGRHGIRILFDSINLIPDLQDREEWILEIRVTTSLVIKEIEGSLVSTRISTQINTPVSTISTTFKNTIQQIMTTETGMKIAGMDGIITSKTTNPSTVLHNSEVLLGVVVILGETAHHSLIITIDNPCRGTLKLTIFLADLFSMNEIFTYSRETIWLK
jgi:hypothetical protein